MINIGQFNTLKISHQSEHAVYLDGGEQGDILFNPKDIRELDKSSESYSVFIYTDGKGRLRATTQTPLAKIDEIAWLKVVSLSHAGAFLDWGLDKDLLVPFSEQKQKMVVGKQYLVKLFLDESHRIAASSNMDDFVSEKAVYLREGQKVDLIIAGETDLGFKAVINHKFWGMLYHNELFQKIETGQKTTGFIKKIRADKKIDLVLSQDSYSEKVNQVSEKILTLLKQQGGAIAITDKSSPQLIYETFAVSKKVFKQAVGGLYKQHLISLDKSKSSILLSKAT